MSALKRDLAKVLAARSQGQIARRGGGGEGSAGGIGSGATPNSNISNRKQPVDASTITPVTPQSPFSPVDDCNRATFFRAAVVDAPPAVLTHPVVLLARNVVISLPSPFLELEYSVSKKGGSWTPGPVLQAFPAKLPRGSFDAPLLCPCAELVNSNAIRIKRCIDPREIFPLERVAIKFVGSAEVPQSDQSVCSVRKQAPLPSLTGSPQVEQGGDLGELQSDVPESRLIPLLSRFLTNTLVPVSSVLVLRIPVSGHWWLVELSIKPAKSEHDQQATLYGMILAETTIDLSYASPRSATGTDDAFGVPHEHIPDDAELSRILTGYSQEACKLASLIKARLVGCRDQSGELYAGALPSSAIIHGAPGNGKSEFAARVSGALGAELVSLDPANALFGLHKLVAKCRARQGGSSPCSPPNTNSGILVFLDEIDSLATKDSSLAVLSLVETLCSFHSSPIFVLAATNLLFALPERMRNSSLFTHCVYFGPPGLRERAEVFRLFLDERLHQGDSENQNPDPITSSYCQEEVKLLKSHFADVVTYLDGYSLADIAGILRKVDLYATSRNRSDETDCRAVTDTPIKKTIYDVLLQEIKRCTPTVLKSLTVVSSPLAARVGGLGMQLRRIQSLISEVTGVLTRSGPSATSPAITASNSSGSSRPLFGTRPTSILLYGPPGNGKTQLARHLAASLSFSLISVPATEVVSSYVGESEANVIRIFESAKLAQPSLLFWDEIDVVFPREGGLSSHSSRLLSTFTDMLDSLAGTKVVVIAATNRPNSISERVLGRFGVKLEIPLPEGPEARKEILWSCVVGEGGPGPTEAPWSPKNAGNSDDGAELVEECKTHGRPACPALGDGSELDVILSRIADETKGYSGAELAAVVCKAREHCFSRLIVELRAASGASEDSLLLHANPNQDDFTWALKQVVPRIESTEARKCVLAEV